MFSFRFLIPGWYLRASHLLHMIISKQDIHICYLFHVYLSITLSSVLKPTSSLSSRNKYVYLLEASETSITIWGQEYFQNCYIEDVLWMCYWEKGTVKFLETLVDNVFRPNKTDRHEITKILLKVALNTITLTLIT